MNGIPLILLAVATVIAGQLTLKAGMIRVGLIGSARLRAPGRLLLDAAKVPAVLVGGVLYVTAAMMWLVVLSRVELSYAYPFLGLSYIGVTAGARVVFGERFSARQWMGLAIVVVGVVMVAFSGGPAA